MKNKELTPLEALNVIYKLEDLQGGRDEFWEAFRVIEKELKAFEIIKEHCIDVGTFCDFDTYEDYCKEYGEPDDYIPTTQAMSEEEYDLLKEVL